MIGNSWEGYVVEQVKQIVPSEIDLYYYRTHNGTECDLVLVQGNEAMSCIEIKYTAAPALSKGFQISIEDLGTKKNFIITPRSDTYPISKNVTVCNLSAFLSQHLSSILF